MKYSISSIYSSKNNYSLNKIFEVVLRRLFRYFTSRDDVQVWQKKDRHGRYYWQAYDPMTERRVSFASEAEMRIWIEHRYYR